MGFAYGTTAEEAPPSTPQPPSAKNAAMQTSQEAYEKPGPVGESTEPCNSWVKIRAYYENGDWRTPMSGAPFKLYVDGKLEVEDYLKDEMSLNLPKPKIMKPPTQVGRGGAKARQEFPKRVAAQRRKEAAEIERIKREELGTFDYQNCKQGKVTFEVVIDKEMEKEIAEGKKELASMLSTNVSELRKDMKPFNDEWREHGIGCLPAAAFDGLVEGVSGWLKDQEFLISKEFWSGVWESATETLKAAADIAYDFITDKMWDIDWWGEKVDQAVKFHKQVVDSIGGAVVGIYKTIDDLVDSAADVLSNAGKIWSYRSDILRLPRYLIECDVVNLQRFVDVVLMDIMPETAESLKKSPKWQQVIELMKDKEAINLVGSQLMAMVNTIPPNFWVFTAGSIGAYVVIEVIISVVLGIFTAGAGAAARLAMLAARLAIKGSNALQKAVKTFKRFIEVLEKSINKLGQLGEKMLRGRRHASNNDGRTEQTNDASRNTESDSLDGGQCIVCKA